MNNNRATWSASGESDSTVVRVAIGTHVTEPSMPQSMIAILAMMLFSLYAVQQQERVYVAQNIMVQQAVIAMLNGAAVERLEEIGATGFDQATVDNETLTASSQLASVYTEFGPGKDHTAEDDLDDFHTAVDTLSRDVSEGTLRFRLYSEVAYASESDPSQESSYGTRTKFKLVTVTAESVELPDLPTVTVTRAFACGSACTW